MDQQHDTDDTKPIRGLMKRPNFLPIRIGAGAAVAILAFAVFSLTSLQAVFVGSPQLAAVASAVLVDLTNADRASDHVGALTVSPILTAAAQAKADDMASKGYFAHVSPAGLDSWYWFEQAGYAFSYAGENLAIDFSDSADVETAWMNSPTHRANLLDPHFTEIGIATAEGMYQGRMTTFVVQLFGAPAIASAATATPASIHPVSESAAPTDIAIATTEPNDAAHAAGEQVLGTSTPGNESASSPISNPPTISAPNPPAPPPVAQDTVPPEAAARSAETYAPAWGLLATSPRTALEYAYYLLGALVLFVLVARTGIELRMHHRAHVIVALCLIVLMLGLFFVASHFVFGQAIVDPVAAFDA